MRQTRTDTRATTSVLGTALLVGLTVVLAATVVATVGSFTLASSTPSAAFDLSVEGDRIELTHVGGDPLEVDSLSLTVAVEGEELDEQPPVPFFSADGFASGPTGPINPASEPEWTPGETVSFQVASTNEPPIEPGDRVTVTVAVDGQRLVTLEDTATAS